MLPAGLRHRVAPEDGAFHDSPATLQLTAAPSCTVDPGAVPPGPPLNRLLGIITGQAPLGEHPLDDGADAIRRLPVKRPAAYVPVHTEKSSSSIGELPILVLGEISCHKRFIRATSAIPNTKLMLADSWSNEVGDPAQKVVS